jgi:hypothetical protein
MVKGYTTPSVVNEEVQWGTVRLVRGTVADPTVINLGPGMPSLALCFCAKTADVRLVVTSKSHTVLRETKFIRKLLIGPKAKLEAILREVSFS